MIAAALFPALALFGCSLGGSPQERQLSGGRAAVSLCAPQKVKPVYVGNMPVLSSEAPGGRITSVSLTEPVDANLQNAFLVPSNGQPMGTTINPKRDALPGWDWTQRIEATNAVLPDSDQRYDLTVEVVRQSKPMATFSAVRVDYELGGKKYFSTYPLSVTLTDRPCSDVDWQPSN